MAYEFILVGHVPVESEHKYRYSSTGKAQRIEFEDAAGRPQGPLALPRKVPQLDISSADCRAGRRGVRRGLYPNDR